MASYVKARLYVYKALVARKQNSSNWQELKEKASAHMVYADEDTATYTFRGWKSTPTLRLFPSRFILPWGPNSYIEHLHDQPDVKFNN